MKYKYTRKEISRKLKELYPSPCRVRDLADDLLVKSTVKKQPKKIEKLYGNFTELDFIGKVWKKQCEVIDVVNDLLKEK